MVVSEEFLVCSGWDHPSAARAVVVPTGMVLPILPIRMRRIGLLSWIVCFRKLKMLPLFLLLRLPSLLLELPSGTLVSALRSPPLGRWRWGFTLEDEAAVISPRGGR